jgi:integrase/recombinase XerD
LRVQRVVMGSGEPLSWTVLDRAWSVLEPAEAFLAHLHAVERSPNTVKAYAHDLRDWFEFLDGAGMSWSAVRLEDVGRFVAWLRLPPVARDGRVVALPSAERFCAAATVNRKLSAVSSFYEFHHRHGVDLGDLLTTWRTQAYRGGSWRPSLRSCDLRVARPCSSRRRWSG